jgi:hypothetical protein
VDGQLGIPPPLKKDLLPIWWPVLLNGYHEGCMCPALCLL